MHVSLKYKNIRVARLEHLSRRPGGGIARGVRLSWLGG